VALAGVQQLNTASPTKAITKADQLWGGGEIDEFHWSDVKALAGYKKSDPFGLHDLPSADVKTWSEWFRAMQEKYLWNALGVRSGGWFAGFFCSSKGDGRRRIPSATAILLMALTNILVWCAIEFGPGYTIIAGMFSADFLLLSIDLLAFLLELPAVLKLIFFQGTGGLLRYLCLGPSLCFECVGWNEF
jgi:hypothetical protein